MSEQPTNSGENHGLTANAIAAIQGFPSRMAKKAPEYGVTAAQATVLMLAEHVALPLLDAVTRNYGIRLINYQNDQEAFELIDKHPVLGTALATVIAPALEELIFRQALPAGLGTILKSLRPNDEGDINWKVGIPVTALFALVHDFGTEGEGDEERPSFQKDLIPLGQFVTGLALWVLKRKKGIDHAIVAHATFNATYFLLEKILDHIDSPHALRRQAKERGN